jgi:adenylylsulfate kinase-like enzyme
VVVWFIGISGSGKSTLGNLLKGYFDTQNIRSFVLDGDLVRNFFNNDLGYSEAERRQNIKRIMLAAAVLEKNGITPIVCNISPFEDLREFARDSFENYNQIFLRKNIQVAQKNDVKNVYKENQNKTPIVGLDLNFDEPKKSELVIDVDGDTVDESFNRITSFLSGQQQK